MTRVLPSAVAVAILLAVLLLGSAAAGAGKGQDKTVHVYVVTPSGAYTPITAVQAEQSIRKWLGSPTDAACFGDGCSIEGWFRRQIGQVFDYDITTVTPLFSYTGQVGDCANAESMSVLIFDQIGYFGYSVDGRTMGLVLGQGGWAGHVLGWRKQQDGKGLVGDWGVQAETGVRFDCVPFWVTQATAGNGFGHEFEGMMYAFVGTVGPQYTFYYPQLDWLDFMKQDVLRKSGLWLRDP